MDMAIAFHHEVRDDLAKISPSLGASLLKVIAGWSQKGLPRKARLWGPTEQHQFFTVSDHLIICHIDLVVNQVLVLSLRDAEESFSVIDAQNPPQGGF